MKKLVKSLVLLFATAVQAFALKLPTGDNVRALDVTQDGDALVSVVLGGDEPVEITTPIGIVKADKGTPVQFYKSGALKSLYPTHEKGAGLPLETPVGTLVPNGDYTTYHHEEDFCLEFYESGSPKRLHVQEDAVINVGGYEYGVKGGYFERTGISFYDSGSKDVWQVRTLLGMEYEKDGKRMKSVPYQNAAGSFELSLDKDTHKANRIEFWQDGSVKAAPLFKSPNATAVVKGSEVFVRGGRVNKNFADKGYQHIAFFADGSIAEFVPDEVCMTSQSGLMLNIVAGCKVSLWKNGNVRQCSVSNENTVKMGAKSYTLHGTWDYRADTPLYDVYLFNEDGSLCAFSVAYWNSYAGLRMVAADTFYDDGSIKRTINVLDEYSNAPTSHGAVYAYVNSFYNPAGVQFEGGGESIIQLKDGRTSKRFYLQAGDRSENVAMLFFANDGSPSSYTLFKLDEGGDYALDEYGSPVADTVRKQFTTK